MTLTNFRKPKTGDKLLRVRFRGGMERGPYTARMMRWTDSGHAFDAVAVEVIAAVKREATWTPTSGGY